MGPKNIFFFSKSKEKKHTTPREQREMATCQKTRNGKKSKKEKMSHRLRNETKETQTHNKETETRHEKH